MKNIIFIAPPAAGKGTISDYLVKNYNYEHLSTGDLLREVIKSGSDFGKEIESITSSGKLVSDEIIIRLVSDKLKTIPDNRPFILDGFPRTLSQAKSLDEMLISHNITNIMVAYLDIDLEIAMTRVLGRIICPDCQRSYNFKIEELKPKKINVCDDCGVELINRSDDNEETFKVRFDTYLENTSPIINYYKEKGILKTFDVRRDPNSVCLDISREVKND